MFYIYNFISTLHRSENITFLDSLTSELQTPITFYLRTKTSIVGMHFLSWNMRTILVPKLVSFAKIFRFSSSAPPSSVQCNYLFYITSTRSYDVTFQSYDVELF